MNPKSKLILGILTAVAMFGLSFATSARRRIARGTSGAVSHDGWSLGNLRIAIRQTEVVSGSNSHRASRRAE